MKIVKTILAAVCICTGIFSSDMVYAGSRNASPEDSDTAAQEELLDPENPAFQEKKKEEEVKIPGLTKQQAASYMSPYTGKVYIHAESKKNHRAVYGIDVSKWQGEINWEKVKKAGIEFAFIRCGYTAKSGKFASYEDKFFEKNIVNANAAGIKTGVYYFSNSKTKEEAIKEAEQTLSIIKKYKNLISLPVVYDFEAFSDDFRAYHISKKTATENAAVYLDIIENAGYKAAYYGCPDIFQRYFDLSRLNKYQCWLANYTTRTQYTGDYDYWQYSETGKVDGINGNVDCNFYYSPDTENTEAYYGSVDSISMKSNSMTSITIKWGKAEAADGYRIYRSKVLNGDYKKIKTIKGNHTFSYKDTNVIKSEGRQYYYKVVPYKTAKNGTLLYGKESDTLKAYTKRKHKFSLKTKAEVNLRKHAGTEYTVITSIPKGKTMPFFKYAIDSKGEKWYKATYKKKGKSYTGYIHGNYVKTYKK